MIFFQNQSLRMTLFLDITSESSISHAETVSLLNSCTETNNERVSLFSKSAVKKSFVVGFVLCILIVACYSYSKSWPEVRVKGLEYLSSNFSETHLANTKYNREAAWVFVCHKYCCKLRGGGWFDRPVYECSGDMSCYYLCCQGQRNNWHRQHSSSDDSALKATTYLRHSSDTGYDASYCRSM